MYTQRMFIVKDSPTLFPQVRTLVGLCGVVIGPFCFLDSLLITCLFYSPSYLYIDICPLFFEITDYSNL